MSSPLSPLERALIELVASENWRGFRTDSLVVTRRENTGAGSYVYIEDKRNQKLPDGTYAAQGRLLEMAGVPSGLAFMVDVSRERINYLEIAVYGDEGWDGVEREWRIV
jgi:hypothetical protein